MGPRPEIAHSHRGPSGVSLGSVVAPLVLLQICDVQRAEGVGKGAAVGVDEVVQEGQRPHDVGLAPLLVSDGRPGLEDRLSSLSLSVTGSPHREVASPPEGRWPGTAGPCRGRHYSLHVATVTLV